VKKLEGKVTKYYCDRCEKAFAESTPFETVDTKDASVARGATILMPSVKYKEVKFAMTDLCGGCVSALSKWMKRK